jgi:hypothetical protein
VVFVTGSRATDVILLRETIMSKIIAFVAVVAAGMLAFIGVARAQVSFEVLHAFTGGSDGAYASGPLIQGTDGNFYGTTAGAVFQMTPDGTVTVLHAFMGGMDGAGASGPLIQGTDGNFYGTTTAGGGGTGVECGSFGCGTVFQMTPDGTVTILYAFAGGIDGSSPSTGIIQATDRNFYGTTRFGGGTAIECGSRTPITLNHAIDQKIL